MSKAAFHATLHTEDYRGDHSTDVEIALEVGEGETVSELVHRILEEPRLSNHPARRNDTVHFASFISLRLVKPRGEASE